MSQDQRPIRECLNELTKLIQSGASGSFYLASPDNDIAVISILRGTIDAVNFQGRRGDWAVELLKDLKIARCSFHTEQVGAAKYSQLSEPARRWLTGAPGPTRATAPSSNTQNDKPDLGRYRRSVESVALSFLGPMARTLCDSVFADCTTLAQAVDELAANLPPEEAARFRGELGKILKK